jgi:hypothetical protein
LFIALLKGRHWAGFVKLPDGIGVAAVAFHARRADGYSGGGDAFRLGFFLDQALDIGGRDVAFDDGGMARS